MSEREYFNFKLPRLKWIYRWLMIPLSLREYYEFVSYFNVEFNDHESLSKKTKVYILEQIRKEQK